MVPFWTTHDHDDYCSRLLVTGNEPVISFILVYAGTPTIFANFRTFIRLYLIIFHCYIALYIATLHHTSTSHSYSYVTALCHAPTLQPYVATLRRTSMPHLRHITTALLHRIVSPPPRVAPRDKSGDRTISGRKVDYSIECMWLCNKSGPFLRFLWHSLRRFFDLSQSRPSY
jgi:hypothetical protein